MSFIWPPYGDLGSVSPSNYINVWVVFDCSWASLWSGVNLTLFCFSGGFNSSTGTHYCADVPENPLPGSGQYRGSSFATRIFLINIVNWPATCFIRLTKYLDGDIAVDGLEFSVRTDSAPIRTYKIPASASTSQVSVTESPSSSSKQPHLATETTPTFLESSGFSVPPLGAPTNVSSQDSTPATSLGVGAKAGIGVGVGTAAIIIALLVWLILLLKRRKTSLSTSAPATGWVPQDFMKPELISILPMQRQELAARPVRQELP